MGVKKIMNLTALADKYGCDKGSIKHNYTVIYNNYFECMIDDRFKMLEIGFAKGASVNMWLEYFKNIILYCIDIAEELPEDKENLKFISADQSSVEQMSEVFKRDLGDFKIIIDDGSHRSEDIMCSFGYLFPHTAPGGLYIIEDLNCKRTPNEKFGVVENRVIKILKEYNNTGIFNSKILTKEQIAYIEHHIMEVEVYKDKIAFIRKGL